MRKKMVAHIRGFPYVIWRMSILLHLVVKLVVTVVSMVIVGRQVYGEVVVMVTVVKYQVATRIQVAISDVVTIAGLMVVVMAYLMFEQIVLVSITHGVSPSRYRHRRLMT